MKYKPSFTQGNTITYLKSLQCERIQLSYGISKDYIKIVSHSNRTRAMRIGCWFPVFKDVFRTLKQSVFPKSRFHCIYVGNCIDQIYFHLMRYLMLHIFPRVNSTLDLDLVQFINSLHALFQNVTNLTRQQHVAIRYLETCKRRLVENLIIQDHHCSKMAGGLKYPDRGCDQIFVRKDALDRHKKIHLAPEEQEVFRCPVCFKKF